MMDRPKAYKNEDDDEDEDVKGEQHVNNHLLFSFAYVLHNSPLFSFYARQPLRRSLVDRPPSL
jgi:hypothetical protein